MAGTLFSANRLRLLFFSPTKNALLAVEVVRNARQ